jgi:hypothetical protein
MDAIGPWAKHAQLRFRVDFVTLCERFICDVRILDCLHRIPVIEKPPACSLTFDVDQATKNCEANTSAVIALTPSVAMIRLQ